MRQARAAARPDELGLAADRRGDALALAFHRGEERGQLVVVRLIPAFAGVVVALRAFEPHAEEDLADEGGRVRGVALVAPDGHRTVLMRAALRGEEFAHEPVPRLVRAKLWRIHSSSSNTGFTPTREGFGRMRSAHLTAQWSAHAGSSSSCSIHWSRFRGSLLSRKARASATVGSRPAASSEARLRNSASVHVARQVAKFFQARIDQRRSHCARAGWRKRRRATFCPLGH